MRTNFLFILLLPTISSFFISFDFSSNVLSNVSYNVSYNVSSGNIASSVLDYVPFIGNIKNFGEAIIGKDIVTDEKLSTGERIFSFFASIPGLNIFKNKKHLKNAKKFYEASKRAKLANKIKNFFKFGKAAERATKKSNFVYNIANKVFKSAKSFFKNFRN